MIMEKKMMKMMMTRKRMRRRSICSSNIMWWLMLLVAATTTGGSVAQSFVVPSIDAAASTNRMNRRNISSSSSSSRRLQEQEDTAYTQMHAALSSSVSVAQEVDAPNAVVNNGQEQQNDSDVTTFAAAATAAAVRGVIDDPATKRKRRLAVRMAFLTGMTDVALSMQFQSFCTMLTGALLWVSRSIIEVQLETLRYFGSIILCYMCGIALARSLRHAVITKVETPPTGTGTRDTGASSSKRLLRIVGTLVMVLFTAADVAFYTMQSTRWLPMSLLAIAYGLINSMGTDFAGTLTFVVTGHLTKLTHLLTDCLLKEAFLSNTANVEAAKMSLQVIASFTAGAMLGFYLHFRHNLLLRRGIFSMLGLGYATLFYTFEGKRIRHWWSRRQVPDMEIRPPLVRIFSLSQAKQKVKEAMARLALQDSTSSGHQKQQQQQQQQHDVVLRTFTPNTSYNVTNMVLAAINDAVANDTNLVLVMPAVATVTAPNNITASVDSLLLEDAPSQSEMGKQQEDVVVFVLQDDSNATTASLPIEDIPES